MLLYFLMFVLQYVLFLIVSIIYVLTTVDILLFV